MDEMVRQRLAGALVLGGIAAIVLPLLFGSPKDPRSSIQASFSGTPVPAPSPIRPPSSTPSPVRESRPSSSAAPRKVLPEASPQRTAPPLPSVAPRPVPTPEPTPEPTPRPPASGWVLQLASYRDPDAAEAFVARLRRDGYQAFRESAKIGDRSYHRVRLGLSMSREEAETLQRSLEKRYRLKAQLFAAR